MTNNEINTPRTLLRKYIASDREIFADYFTDVEITRLMGNGPCESRDEAYALFEKCFDVYNGIFKNRHFEIWGIESEGELAGHFELKQSENTEGNELEIVYLLGKQYWGRGLMPEILTAINDYAHSLGKCLIATVHPENTNSLKVLRKVGIERDGWIGDDGDKAYKLWLAPPFKK
jgi:RimJ/RimL family protein N-acetyltransferase